MPCEACKIPVNSVVVIEGQYFTCLNCSEVSPAPKEILGKHLGLDQRKSPPSHKFQVVQGNVQCSKCNHIGKYLWLPCGEDAIDVTAEFEAIVPAIAVSNESLIKNTFTEL